MSTVPNTEGDLGLTMAPMDRGRRRRQVVAAMAEVECDAMVVTKPENIRWLTGFTGSNGTVVMTAAAMTVVTDARYTTQVAQQLNGAGIEAGIAIDREGRDAVIRAVGDARAIGLEAHHITWARQRAMADWFGRSELRPLGGTIDRLRRIKDEGELDRLRRAAAIADGALAGVRSGLVPGRTERSIARALDQAMLDGGADDLSFPTIVASGPNSAKPHARPTDRELVDGDLVVIDFGASVDGYGSDMTRSFLIGHTDGEEADRRRGLYRAVEEAQAAGVATVKAGVEERRVDEVCRSALARHGLAEAFVHGTGHGIGLEIHENPILSARATGILRSGYVVTVEPGAYLPDIGGVRIEDSIVVTDHGCETITLSPKNPVP